MLSSKVYVEDNSTYIALYLNEEYIAEYELVGEKEKHAIYKSIYDNKPVALHKKFFVDFSIGEYRDIYSLKKDEMVDIYVDSIFECFFYSCKSSSVDFSFCRFHAFDATAGLLMDDNYFFNTLLNFSYSDFLDFDLSLAGCTFFNSKIEFIYSKFGNQDIRFDKTTFKGSDNIIKFYGTNLGDAGEIVFNDIKSMNGYIELNNVSFGHKRLSFIDMDCPNGDIYFMDSELTSIPIEFADSYLNIILFYKINSNGILNLKIASANNIIIQDCVIRDCALLGNKGYRNITNYCFKGTTILGKIRFENKFTKHLFNKQKQFIYDPRINKFVFCDTSFNDKADQMMLISNSFRSEGNSNSEDFADSAYRLSKRYKSLGRMQECIYDYPSVNRTEEYTNKFFKKVWAYVSITIRLVIASFSYLFEKVFLDVFCGRYATKPSRFLFWINTQIIGFAVAYAWISKSIGLANCFSISNAFYETINPNVFYVIYSLLVYFQIEFGDIIILHKELFYIALIEKVVGLIIFTLFAVSFTRKVIK